jgi:predicted ArsR family transcriptional regulator
MIYVLEGGVMDLGDQAAGIGSLADDTRRTLYEFVVAQADAVTREQAATATGLPLHKASFHLDRLVTEGLLEVEFRRLTGRAGPGAGRPSKLYRRADREFAISLPQRRYDLVGEILAAAVTRAAAGTSLEEALDQCAREEGLQAGGSAGAVDRSVTLEMLCDVLARQGYEPRIEGEAIMLANCPFDSLARKHTGLVCGLNLSFVQGVADGLGCDAIARLEPSPERCCVTAGRR